MRKYIFLAFILCALQSFAGVPASYGKRLNALTDMPLIGLQNFSGAGVLDESAKLQALYNKFNNVDATSLRDSGFTIFWPEGINLVKVNNQVFGEGYVKIEGAHFFYDDGATMGESTPMILFIGKSYVSFSNCQFTGSHTKLIGALVQLNSNPNHCVRPKFYRCYFGDAAARNALNFGAAGSDNDWDYWIDRGSITYSGFKHLYYDGYQRTPEDIYGSLAKYYCNGINLQQTCLRMTISHNEGEDVSGDWLTGKGSTRAMKQHRKAGKYYGNWIVTWNIVEDSWMAVELNGNTRGSGLSICDNTFKNCNRKGGYLISSNMSDGQMICRNTLENDDRGLIEFGGNGCLVSHNIGKIFTFKDTTEGYPPTAMVIGSNRIHFIEGYGNSNRVTENIFTADRSNPYIYSPAEYDGIAIYGMTTSPDYGDTVYNGSKRPTDWDISNNTLNGVTHRVLDISTTPVDKLRFANNKINSSVLQETPIKIWGDKWVVIINEFNLDGCYPTNGNALITLNEQQKTSPTAIVANNICWNTAWKNKWFLPGASATNIFK